MRLTPQLGRSLKIVGIDVDDQQTSAEVRAVPGGMVAWLLGRLGFGTVHVFSITQHGFRFEQASAFGDYRHCYPISAVSATVYEHRRPRGFLIASLAMLITAVVVLFSGSVDPAILVLTLAVIVAFPPLADRIVLLLIPLIAALAVRLAGPAAIGQLDQLLLGQGLGLADKTKGNENSANIVVCALIALGFLVAHAVLLFRKRKQIIIGIVLADQRIAKLTPFAQFCKTDLRRFTPAYRSHISQRPTETTRADPVRIVGPSELSTRSTRPAGHFFRCSSRRAGPGAPVNRRALRHRRMDSAPRGPPLPAERACEPGSVGRHKSRLVLN